MEEKGISYMSENKDVQIMQIPDTEYLVKSYQSLYYAMNAKPDCKSKLFDNNVVINMQDIKNLNYKITEKFKAHYDNDGFRINVIVNLKGNEIIEFDSWATFEQYDFKIEKSINSILIVWEFNINLPQFPLPQKHTLTVRLADGIRPEEMLNLVISGKLEEIDKMDQETCAIVARVDFINSILGDELLRIVELWQDGLETADLEQHKMYNTLKKYSRLIAYAINYISVIIVAWHLINWLDKQVSNLDVKSIGEISISEFGELFNNFIFGILICMVTYKIFEVIANIVFSTLRSKGDSHTFNITNGDSKICKKVEKRIKHKKLKIVGNIAFTFFFDVVCNIVASYFS